MFCGAIVEYGEDFVSDVGISTSSLAYPRLLQAATEFEGKEQLELKCNDPRDCTGKCDMLEKRSRDGGLPAPLACALCTPPCPDNPGTSLVATVHAFADDVVSAVQLAMICLNPVACVCQILMMIKPAWIGKLHNSLNKCIVADIFQMLLDQIVIMFLKVIEDAVNTSDLFKSLQRIARDWGHTIPNLCLEHKSFFDEKTVKHCCSTGGGSMMETLAILRQSNPDVYGDNYDTMLSGTSSDPTLTHAEIANLCAKPPFDTSVNTYGCDPRNEPRVYKQCYWARKESICRDKNFGERYEDLFTPPTLEEGMAEFQKILGDSFDEINPAITEQLTINADGPVNTVAMDLGCGDLDADEVASRNMRLDHIILACMFHHIETFCPGGSSDDNVHTFLRDVEWQLPKVIWDWSSAPPPPPPEVFGPYDDLIADDPQGMQFIRETLFELFPSLELVASQRGGSTVGREHSPDDDGLGGIYNSNKYVMTTAFLSTAHFKNQDSLSARIVQARFTGMFRFACKSFVRLMSDVSLSAAGVYGQTPAEFETAFQNPADFSGNYDRNYVAMAAALFSQSYFHETGEYWNASVHTFWDENCVAPAIDRAPVNKELWQSDAMVYGERDINQHDTTLSDYGPLRTFGSLRQIRDTLGGGLDPVLFPEDYTNKGGSKAGDCEREYARTGETYDQDHTGRQCDTNAFAVEERRIRTPILRSNELQGPAGDIVDLFSVSSLLAGRRLNGGAGDRARARDAAIKRNAGGQFAKSTGEGGYSNAAADAEATSTESFRNDRYVRNSNSLANLHRNRICHPAYKYSIEQAIGDPPVGSTSVTTTKLLDLEYQDTSTILEVAASHLGSSATKRMDYIGCGMGIDPNACDPGRAPTYEDSSLWQWAYVTSSQCKIAFQTNTRTLIHTHLCHRLTFAPLRAQ